MFNGLLVFQSPTQITSCLALLCILERINITNLTNFTTSLHAVHPQQTRSRTLTVTVTYPGTNANNCSLTSSIDHTTICPLGHWYSSFISYIFKFQPFCQFLNYFWFMSEFAWGWCSKHISINILSTKKVGQTLVDKIWRKTMEIATTQIREKYSINQQKQQVQNLCFQKMHKEYFNMKVKFHGLW